MLAETSTAPTLREAQRAAEELARAGAARVLLFGSVACGEARLGSDIDLVAVFDDIDYSRRLAMQLDLQAAAESVVGHRVEVLVTDWPEWRCRTREVTASLEAAISSNAVVMFDRKPSEVLWDKEIGLPDDNNKEALGRLAEAWKALTEVLDGTSMKESERLELAAGREEGVLRERHWRLMAVCQHGAEAIETSVKCLVALAGNPVRWKHDIETLLSDTGDYRPQAERALSSLERSVIGGAGERYGDITMWRQAGTYVSERAEIDLEVSSCLAPLIANAALEVTAVAAAELSSRAGNDPAVTGVTEFISALRVALSERDLIAGRAAHRRSAPEGTEGGPAGHELDR